MRKKERKNLIGEAPVIQTPLKVWFVECQSLEDEEYSIVNIYRSTYTFGEVIKKAMLQMCGGDLNGSDYNDPDLYEASLWEVQ